MAQEKSSHLRLFDPGITLEFSPGTTPGIALKIGLTMSIKNLIAAVALITTSPAVLAQAALLDFSSSMYSFSADFTQTVYDSDSVALQESVGSVELMRPGRFRWTYVQPNSQLIVADGLTLWVYDEDIKQVTARPQSSTLGSAPIGLLSGQKTIESEFNVTELGTEAGLQWFELEPMVQDTDFNAIYIAIDENGLHAMELRDNFDQATQIKFTNFKKNVVIDQDRFKFTPPEGSDVVGEVGVAQPLDSQGFPQPEIREIGDDEIIDGGEVKADGGEVKAIKPLDAGTEAPAAQTTTDTNTDPDLPPIVDGEPVVEPTAPTTVIDGNQLQIQEIRE